jgi:hypothetical protein
MQEMSSKDAADVLKGATSMNQVLQTTDNSAMLQQLFEANAIPLLLEVAKGEAEPDIQLEALCCLASFATFGTDNHCAAILDAQGLPIFFNLLERKQPQPFLLVLLLTITNLACFKNLEESRTMRIVSTIMEMTNLEGEFDLQTELLKSCVVGRLCRKSAVKLPAKQAKDIV